MVTPELSDHLATWISDNKAIGVSSITLQLRGSISDNSKEGTLCEEYKGLVYKVSKLKTLKSDNNVLLGTLRY
jgi:hypothetical protein